MSGITDQTQYDRLTEDWRQIHNVIWGIPSIAVSIIAGVIIVAYNLEGWPRIALLSLGSIFLFSMTVEIVKKRLTMDAISARMQRIERRSRLTIGPFPSKTRGLIDEQEKAKDEENEAKEEKNREEQEGTKDFPYLLFKLFHARTFLTYVLFTAAILASILSYWEFIKYLNYQWWSYWVGISPVVIISIATIVMYAYKMYVAKHKHVNLGKGRT